MLEQVDLTQALDKANYKKRMAALKLKMYDIGHAVYESHTPVVVVFEGWHTAGKGRTIAELTATMDPRGFRVYPIIGARPDEDEYPWLRRFWLMTPERGQIALFHTSWYRRVLTERLAHSVSKKESARAFQDIQEFERVLADDGVLIVKFWLHISKKEQKRRLNKLLSEEATAWRVDAQDRREHKEYDEYARLAEETFARSDAAYAPWTLVPATDRRWTNVQVFETIIARLQPRVAAYAAPLPPDIEESLRELERHDHYDLTEEKTVEDAAPASPKGAGSQAESEGDDAGKR